MTTNDLNRLLLSKERNMDHKIFKKGDMNPLEWRISDTPIPYDEALHIMELRVAEIASGTAPELIWLLEHPPLYTAGTSAKQQDLLAPERFPVYVAGRGGQYTYHGPGQRIVYVMLDLKNRGTDIRKFVNNLEQWAIDTLEDFNIRAERRCDRVGVWVMRPEKGVDHEDKIAAIGVRIRKWVTFHGMALNVNPNLEHFSGIVPCGIGGGGLSAYGVTSLEDLGQLVTLPDVDLALRRTFEKNFGT